MALSATSGLKKALIIGINDYPNSKLNHCINDATDIKNALQRIVFQILKGIHCNKKKFDDLIKDFIKGIESQDLILLYFAGHGNQFEDKNYLLPAGYSYNHSKDERAYIQENAICAQCILHEIEAKKPYATIFILDCCRNYVKMRNNDSQKGLAAMRVPPDSLLAFFCGFNTGAIYDTPNDRNGIFTEHLLNHIENHNNGIETA